MLDFERLLSSSLPNLDEFGYYSKVFGENKGVIIIIGSDHGGGKSRFLIRTNYLDSKSRREVNKADYGTRTLQFAEVKCKKDVHEVHSKISPDINIAIKKLESSKLVAVKSKQKIVKCVFVPKDATNLLTVAQSNSMFLQYQSDDKTQILPLNLQQDGDNMAFLEGNTVIPNFKVVIAGDLSYFATCTGRDGHSHCRCPYCDATQSDWSNKYVQTKYMSLATLHHYASIKKQKNNDTKGVIMGPLLEV